MSGSGAGPVRVGEAVEAFLERKGMRAQIDRVGVIDRWPGRVGEAIARVARPRAVSGSTLVVEVRSSAWLMELEMMKGPILRRLNEGSEVPLVDRIVFVMAETAGDEERGARGGGSGEPAG